MSILYDDTRSPLEFFVSLGMMYFFIFSIWESYTLKIPPGIFEPLGTMYFYLISTFINQIHCFSLQVPPPPFSSLTMLKRSTTQPWAVKRLYLFLPSVGFLWYACPIMLGRHELYPSWWGGDCRKTNGEVQSQKKISV